MGCSSNTAEPQTAENNGGAEESDYLEDYNRWMTGVNDDIYMNIIFPIGRGYRAITTKGVRRGIKNFFHNLAFPVRFVNNILQAKFLCAGKELLRFCINTTIGLLGFFDPAKDWFGIEACEEDFGQTLGFWGVGPGPHIVLPVLGPTNLRDMTSLYVDTVYDPLYYLDRKEYTYTAVGFRSLTEFEPRIEEYDSIKKDAFDLYLFMRDAYEQNREKKIEE